jgi:hypothetical protein
MAAILAVTALATPLWICKKYKDVVYGKAVLWLKKMMGL